MRKKWMRFNGASPSDGLGCSSLSEGYAIMILFSVLVFCFTWSSGAARLMSAYLDESVRDLTMRYRESKYLLHGVDPFDVMSGELPVDESIGWLWATGGTVPWAISMGIILNFVFLPEAAAHLAACLLFAAVIAAFALMCYSHCRSELKMEPWQAALVCIMSLALPGVGTGVTWLNYGTICGLLLVIAYFLSGKRPYIAGVLLAVASIKPQLAITFYIMLFLKRQWRILIPACAIPLFFWAVAIFLSKTGPLELLLEMLTIGESYGVQGIFKPLQYTFQIPLQDILLQLLNIGFVFGLTAFCFAFCGVLKDPLASWTIPACLTGMWMYTQEHDRCVWAFVILYLMYLVFRKAHSAPLPIALCFVLMVDPSLVSSLYQTMTNTLGVTWPQHFFQFIRNCAALVSATIAAFSCWRGLSAPDVPEGDKAV